LIWESRKKLTSNDTVDSVSVSADQFAQNADFMGIELDCEIKCNAYSLKSQ